MQEFLSKLPLFEEKILSFIETIIANIVLIGQIPAPTFQEKHRTRVLLERLAEFQVDECTTDGYRNPIGIIRGRSHSKPPIFVVAHMDTAYGRDVDHNFTVHGDNISGPGVLDNSVGVGVMASLPEIFRRLEVSFESDIVLAGVIQSIGRGNLRGIRHLIKTWSTPIRGAVCIEGGELGRLNYYSDGMIRCEICCKIAEADTGRHSRPNAILIVNEIINQMLALRLPQRPRSEIVIGTISGGLKHGSEANEATLGFEIRSDADQMVHSLYTDIKDIVDGIGNIYQLEIQMNPISNLSASQLKYNHPLVKSATAVMHQLGLKPASVPSESELSIFLSRKIPTITLGVTHGKRYQDRNSIAEITPIAKGIAQIIGVILAIDSGVCDEN
jgi:tripeptide aminopeptidase